MSILQDFAKEVDEVENLELGEIKMDNEHKVKKNNGNIVFRCVFNGVRNENSITIYDISEFPKEVKTIEEGVTVNETLTILKEY